MKGAFISKQTRWPSQLRIQRLSGMLGHDGVYHLRFIPEVHNPTSKWRLTHMPPGLVNGDQGSLINPSARAKWDTIGNSAVTKLRIPLTTVAKRITASSTL